MGLKTRLAVRLGLRRKPDHSRFRWLPDEILYMILCLAMWSEFPVKIENRCIFHHSGQCPGMIRGSKYLEQKRKHYFDNMDAADKAHGTDWIAMNSTCARFRQVGTVAFFEEKIFILHIDTLRQLYVVKTRSILPTDLTNNRGESAAHWEIDSEWENGKDTVISGPCMDMALTYIRHLYLIDPDRDVFRVDRYDLLRELPTRLSLFPRLRRLTRCTLSNTCSFEIMCMGELNLTTPAELKELVESMQRALVRHGISERVKVGWQLCPEEVTENWVLERVHRSTKFQIQSLQWIPDTLNEKWEKISPQPITEYRDFSGRVKKIGGKNKRKSRSRLDN